MKATRNKVNEVEWRFPCLGIREDQGLVVLFKESQSGTVVMTGNSPHYYGSYLESWSMNFFKPLPSTESVTLQND